MSTMQVVGALAMMLSGTSIGVRCAMGFMYRYGWEHRPLLSSVPMAGFAMILFTRGLTAIQGIQALTPWGETVAIVGSLWFFNDVVRSFVRAWKREGVSSTLDGVISAPVPAWRLDELRRLRTR